MPLAHKTTTSAASALPDALKNQISNNFKKDDDFKETVTSASAPVTAAGTAPSSAASAPAAFANATTKTGSSANTETQVSSAKSKYADSVNLRLTSGKRSEFKKFFTDCEISMNQGFEMAVDYILREAKAGRISVSKSGITKVGEL